MMKHLRNTNSAKIGQAIADARPNGAVSSGMVFTLIVVADSAAHFKAVFEACRAAAKEHPSRILVVRNAEGDTTGVDADVHMDEESLGEIVVLTFTGELTQHRDSVLLPLLLPDSPVVVWWTGNAPAMLADDPIGKLGTRRITDATSSSHPVRALTERAQHLAPGDTDLTWTRVTPWRALLTAALDQYPAQVVAASVSGAQGNPGSLLLHAWLECRLGIEVTRTVSRTGFGITEVMLATTKGDIRITRDDGRVATFTAPGLPARKVALRRRDVTALISEELRFLDEEPVLAATMACLAGKAPVSSEAEGAGV